MAFCMKCGAPVEGAFCTKCGTPVGSPGVSNAQAGQPVPPIPASPQPSTAAPAAKKGRAIFWILGGCLGLVVIAGIIVVATGLFVVKKAGLDPDLMRKDPALAVAKMVATMNPDIEVLSVDESAGVIHVRDKKTGKTLKMNLKDAQKGRIVFQDDQNKTVEIKAQGEGDNASLEVNSPDGNMRMGTGSASRLPAWLPSYPGAKAAGNFSFEAKEGKAESYTLTTSDSAETVAAFYEKALNGSGFEVQKNVTQIPGKGSMVFLMAEDKNAGRNVQLTAEKTEEGTKVTLTYETK